METITSTQTGKQALIPAKTVAGLRKKGASVAVEALDTLVSDAHNNHPVARAVTNALGIKAL